MKAYRIDPVARTVTQVEYDGNFKTIYGLLSGDDFDIDTFDVVRLDRNGDCAFVDDEGLLKPCDAFWKHTNYPGILAGPGLFVGTDMSDGETVEPKASLDEVRGAVTFYNRAEVLKQIEASPPSF